MTKGFSPRTLGEFEDAAASVVLRRIDRVFTGAGIGLGKDPGGLGGDRRTQFRRYVASLDQHDPQQLERLGAALGALIEAVAASKEDFLKQAAERDGFAFVDGVFRPIAATADAFALTRVEDLTLIDDRRRRLHLLAEDRPADAVGGAIGVIESVCRTVSRLVGRPAPENEADVVELAVATLAALEVRPTGSDDADAAVAVVDRCIRQLGAVVASLAELQGVDGPGHGPAGTYERLSPRHARLAVGAALTLAGFVAETYLERTRAEEG